ncbi:MAG: NADH-quinone oxidoreductase subunit N [Pseudohongiellaceae bacterium]|jgi:NADH-quinone oxidoreductase subunit N
MSSWLSADMLADLTAVGPETRLLATIVVAILVDLIFGHRARVAVTVIGMLGTAFALFALFDPALGTGTRAFGLLTNDSYGVFFRTLIIGGTGVLLLHTLLFRGAEESSRNEFVPMFLGTALGACLLVNTDNLVMLLLSMELLSLNSYLLAGWQRKERRSSEAALKYLVYGAVASALMTFGFSLLYGLSGSLNMAEIGQSLSEAWYADTFNEQMAVLFASVLVFVGFGFKVAIVPFHFWAPDVYEGSPTPVTTFLAVVSKSAGFAVLLRFVHVVYLDESVNAAWVERLGYVIAVIAAVTMTYGNITAVLQRNVKRLLAYSSIAHAGYLLMGVAVMTSGSTSDAVEVGMDATLFYMATYYLGTLGAFGCVMSLSNRFGAEDTDDYAGLGWSAPWTCGFLVVFLVSLVGLPPTAGFVGKLWLFNASLDVGLYWLAVVAALNAVVALFYYFKIVRALFLRGDHEERVAGFRATGVMAFLGQASLAVMAVAVVYYCFGFDGLASWVSGSLL